MMENDKTPVKVVDEPVKPSLVDKLLAADKGKVTARPTGTIEIKRLSELLGEPFVIECQALDPTTIDDIQALMVIRNKKGEPVDAPVLAMATQYVIEGCVNPDFKDPKLAKGYGVAAPDDLVRKILTSGEILDVYRKISDLSGLESTDEEFDELKNLYGSTRKQS